MSRTPQLLKEIRRTIHRVEVIDRGSFADE